MGGILELIIDGENGFLVQPNEPEALADKIIYFIRNSNIADDMGKKGREFVTEILSTEKYVRNFQRMIQMSMGKL